MRLPSVHHLREKSSGRYRAAGRTRNRDFGALSDAGTPATGLLVPGLSRRHFSTCGTGLRTRAQHSVVSGNVGGTSSVGGERPSRSGRNEINEFVAGVVVPN